MEAVPKGTKRRSQRSTKFYGIRACNVKFGEKDGMICGGLIGLEVFVAFIRVCASETKRESPEHQPAKCW
jgi:hypothetical protein